MAGATDVAALRVIVGTIAYEVSQAATHATLDGALTQLGLPASPVDGSKAVRAKEASLPYQTTNSPRWLAGY